MIAIFRATVTSVSSKLYGSDGDIMGECNVAFDWKAVGRSHQSASTASLTVRTPAVVGHGTTMDLSLRVQTCPATRGTERGSGRAREANPSFRPRTH
eukprot:2196370-Amphidinium_carterae.1